jgi:hypothetical protein
MTPTAFREVANRQAAVALLPLRIQVLLAAEWARSVLHVLLDADPEYLRPQHALDAAIHWALDPSEATAAQLTPFTHRDGEQPFYLFGTAQLHAVGAVDAAVRAAVDATTDARCDEAVANCGTLTVRGTPAASYALLDTKWKWLFTTYRHALGPGVPFDPEWRTSTALVLAQGIVRERALDRMPILADALRDAGCVEEAVGRMPGEYTLADWTLWNLVGLNEPPSASPR